MKITDLAQRPKLIEVTLDDADTVQELGEPLTYWTWDRQPLSVVMKMASLDPKNTQELVLAVRDLILDEQGQPVLQDERVIPVSILMRIIGEVIQRMGKI